LSVNAARWLLLIVAIACAMPRAVLAQDRGLDEARARWEQMTPEQRAQMRERFERFRQMPPEHREAMEDRARFLREAMRRAEERLSPEDRARIAALAPARRIEVLRDLAMLDGRERGARIHGALPEAWRERLERVPAEERARVLGEMQQKMREHRHGDPRGQGPESRGGPGPEARERGADARERGADARERGGDPGERGGDPGERGADPGERGADPGERGADPGEPGRERQPEPLASKLRKLGLSPEEIARIEALPEAERRREIETLRPRDPGADGQRRAPGPESTPARRRLMEAARPRAADILRLADRPTQERRELIARIVRERIVQVLRAEQLATTQEIAELEKLSLENFRRVMREKFSIPGAPHGEGARGEGRRGEGQPPPGPPRDR